MSSFHVVLKFLMYLCAHSLLPVAVSDDIAECSTDSTDFDDDIFTITCPAGCSPYQYSRRVWGTGVYRSDSSICRAAIHDGRTTNAGGHVTVYRWPGQDFYQGSRQNGIQTWTYRYPKDSSFAFTQVCLDALGMEDGPIEDGDITASSNQESWPPSAARLNGDSAWFPSDSDPFAGSWIQVDLGQQTIVSGVITQGYKGIRNYWVKQYEVWYLNNDEVWAAVTSPTGDVMSFSGNTGPTGQKTNIFYRPIVTQKIQLYPTSWQREPGLRMELLGCDLIASTSQSTIAMRTTSATPRATVMKSTTSPRTITTSTSHQTAGSFSSVTLSTAAIIDGEQEGQKGTRGSLSTGAIVGIAAGVAVVLIAMVVFVIIFLRKRQPSNKAASNVPRSAPEQRFRNPEYSGATVANEHTAPAQDEGYTDCELYNNTEDSNPYEPYNYANSGQIPGGEIPQPHDYDYATIPGESDRGVVDNVIYESSDMT